MLTSDLVRARTVGGVLRPTFLKKPAATLREHVDDLVHTVEAAEEAGWTRAQLSKATDGVITGHRSLKVLKGMRKLLLDRCEFEVDTPVPPAELRKAAFELAAQMGPLALEAGPLERPTADDVFAALAEQFEQPAEVLRATLYGDLKSAQKLSRFRPLDTDALIARYNVALVQAILIRAVQVHVQIHAPSPARLRQLLRFVKFHQLMHRAWREDDVVHLQLDGPTSLFKQSTRYGLQLANFFPGLLLQDTNWTMQGTTLWTKARRRTPFEVTWQDKLKSHYRDTGAWVSREQQWFADRFGQVDTGPWTLSEDVLPIELGGHGVVMPDFTLTDGTRTAHLEIVGFWRKDYLERRWRALQQFGPGNLILAVSTQLLSDKGKATDLPGAVIPFAKALPVGKVLAAAEEVAR